MARLARSTVAVAAFAAACIPETATTTDDAPTTAATTGEPATPTTSGAPTGTTAPESSTGATTGEDGTTAAFASTGEPGGTTAAFASTGEPGGTTGTSTGDASGGTTGTSTGDASGGTTGTSTGAASTGDASTGDASAGDASTGDASTGDGSTTGDGEGDGGLGPACCEKGCSAALFESHSSTVSVHHGGSRIATHDADGKLVLWDADTLVVLRTAEAVARVALVGSTLVYEQQGALHVVDAAGGATLGVCPTDAKWGVARDASYLWTAGPLGLAVRELDCTPRWAAAGDLVGAAVLADAAAVHVFDADLAPQAVVHFAAADGASASAAFAGTFGGWFADVPRYWTVQGQSYRVYDTDGSALIFALGAPKYGWGTRVVIGTSVVDVFAPAVTLATLGFQSVYSGPAILTRDDMTDQTALVRLDLDPVPKTPVAPTCCVEDFKPWTFAWSGGAWAVGGDVGISADHLGRLISGGAVVGLAGAQSGRAAFGMSAGRVRVVDVAGDCSLTVHPDFPRVGKGLWMAGDGSLLLSHETWAVSGTTRQGTRFYALPGGALLDGQHAGLMSDAVVEHEVSDDGALWSRTRANTGLWWYAAQSFPLGVTLTSGQGDVAPKFAPDGQHMVTSDGIKGPIDDWAGSQSYVFDPVDFVAVFAGITHGFLDDAHVLVGHYTAPGDAFAGSEIVDMAGLVVQETTLPDIRKLTRLGTGEILATVHPGGNAAIFDPWTGALLWAAPPGAKVAIAGPDVVLVSDGAATWLERWR